jgi:hypothetical protein
LKQIYLQSHYFTQRSFERAQGRDTTVLAFNSYVYNNPSQPITEKLRFAAKPSGHHFIAHENHSGKAAKDILSRNHFKSSIPSALTLQGINPA